MTARATYLDWNATAPVRPEARGGDGRGAGALRQSVLGASLGPRRAAARSRRARDAVAALVGAPPDDDRLHQRRHRGQPSGARAACRARAHPRLGDRARFGAAGGARRRAGPGRRRRPRRSRRARTAARRRSAPGAGLADARQQRDRRRSSRSPTRRGSRMRTARCCIATRCRPPGKIAARRARRSAPI